MGLYSWFLYTYVVHIFLPEHPQWYILSYLGTSLMSFRDIPKYLSCEFVYHKALQFIMWPVAVKGSLLILSYTFYTKNTFMLFISLIHTLPHCILCFILDCFVHNRVIWGGWHGGRWLDHFKMQRLLCPSVPWINQSTQILLWRPNLDTTSLWWRGKSDKVQLYTWN